MSDRTDDQAEYKEVGWPPPEDPTEPTISVMVGCEEIRNLTFQVSVPVSRSGTLSGITAAVAGIVAFQVFPEQHGLILIATILTVPAMILAPGFLNGRPATVKALRPRRNHSDR